MYIYNSFTLFYRCFFFEDPFFLNFLWRRVITASHRRFEPWNRSTFPRNMNACEAATLLCYGFLFRDDQIDGQVLNRKETARYSAKLYMPIFLFSTRLPLEERSAKQTKTESGKETTRCKPQETSWAVVIWQSLLGRGWKDVLLRMWWLEGRMRAARALLTHSPSTPPILTSEFVMADLLAFS